FFTRGEHSYRVNRQVREAVVFAEQNVISDPPFSRLDLVSCRNVLIYLEPDVQRRVLSLFHFALREGGYLFIGNSETIAPQHRLFKQGVPRKRVRIAIEPLREPQDLAGLLLITFQDEAPADSPPAVDGARPAPEPPHAAAPEFEDGERDAAVRRLEDELRAS